MVTISDLQAGKAGEHLVCADLILGGYIAFLSEQGLSYDVVVDIAGRLVRIQVKATRQPRAVPEGKDYTPTYVFNIRKMGKNGRRAYTAEDVDIFALVALDRQIVGYVAESVVKQTMVCRIRDYEGHYCEEQRAAVRQRILELRHMGLSYQAIGEQLGMDKTQAHRTATHQPREDGRYLDEMSFDGALYALR